MAKIEHACYILGKQAAFAISTLIYIPYDNDMMGVSDTCSIILQLLISEQLIHLSCNGRMMNELTALKLMQLHLAE